MKTTTLLTLTSLLAASPVYAAADASSSGFLLWAFLGFFALLIATQILPSLLLLVGITRAVTHSKKTLPLK
ncbi:hypothetical protein [Desulfuromonas thiophila]|uniref:hypothetical protein n=1 Tax=Desulfuromonas thiophila TaxID=57664 RepID=UPI0029F47DE1|nr:hypothetical protein [Desulfuromonas thiophila]